MPRCLHGRLGWLDHAAPGEVDHPIGDGLRPLVLVRGEDDGAARCPGASKKLVQKITALLVETGMRLVQEPEPSAPSDKHSK